MDFWSQEAVEEALGTELAEASPELLRLTDLEVRIPHDHSCERLIVDDDGWRQVLDHTRTAARGRED
jgi:hypothetical protein